MIHNTNTSQMRRQAYMAAAFGAFFLGFGDLLKNDKHATVLKMSEVIKQHLFPGFGAGALVALLLFVLFGVIVCWIHGPHTKVDAFGRGLSVFALFAVASPSGILETPRVSGDVRSVQIGSVLLWPQAAYAQSSSVTDIDEYWETPTMQGEVVIVLPDLKSQNSLTDTIVTVRDTDTAAIRSLEKVFGSKFKIKQPVGEYLIEVETPGYKRVEVTIEIRDSIAAFNLPLEETRVPLSIQRLVGPSSGILSPAPAESLKQLGIKSFRSKEYEDAVSYYDESIAIDPTDPTTRNYKGYSLFRAGRYDEALARIVHRFLVPEGFSCEGR